MTKRELVLNITLNELYNTHELVQKHIDSVCPAADDHLRIVTNDLGVAPKQVARNENKPVQLPLFSRWETMVPDLTNSLKSVSSPNEVLYANTRGLILHIMRSLPPQKTKGLSLKAVVDQAISYKTDPNVARKGLTAAENLRKLEQEGLVSSADNYAKLTEEVGEELMNLEKLKQKTQQELEALDGVYQLIKEHNDYLKSQLET